MSTLPLGVARTEGLICSIFSGAIWTLPCFLPAAFFFPPVAFCLRQIARSSSSWAGLSRIARSRASRAWGPYSPTGTSPRSFGAFHSGMRSLGWMKRNVR